jgi:hypothetical protein
MQTQRSRHKKKKTTPRKGRVAESKVASDTYKPPVNYLYDSKQSYPVIEYLPSDEELESATLTPSFVLEVTWPRIIQFYHPYSPRCRSFQATFVNVARGIKRRSSRMPIEFYTVNCGIYRELCELGFNVRDVPTIIGLQSGKIEGITISLPGSIEGLADSTKEFFNDVEQKMEYVALTMGFQLDPVKGANLFASHAMSKGIESSSLDEAGIDRVNDRHNNSLFKSTIRQSDDVFNDAMSSLFTAIMSQLSTGTGLPSDASNTLAEFLDLVRWACPPETEIHNFAEDIKFNYEQSIASEEAFLKVVRRHANHVIEFTWSSRCTAKANGGFTCGLWSLLHILTVGVVERHSFVLGDTESVSVIHVGQVIRSFIEQFFLDCDSCRDLWIELFDENCSGMYGMDYSTAENPVDEKIDDDEWRFLALCVWEMHKDYRKMKPSASLWPSQTDCPKCWQSLPGENGLLHVVDSRDKNELYNHLKMTYWQSGRHNNRLIVLNKLSQAKRALSMKRIRARMATHHWSTSLLILNLFVACYMIRILRPRWSSTVLILWCTMFQRGRRAMNSSKRRKKQADQSLINEHLLHSDQSGDALPACTPSSESQYRQSMRRHDGVGHKYTTTSRRNLRPSTRE